MRRVLLPVLVLLSMLAAACGSTSFDQVASDDGPSAATGTGAESEGSGPTDADGVGDDIPTDGDTDASGAEDQAPNENGEGTGEIENLVVEDPEAARLEQAARTTQDEPFRGEMFMLMSMGADGFSIDMGSETAPIAAISYDGSATGMRMDLSVLLGDLFGAFGTGFDTDELGFDPSDLSMDMVMTDDTMYLTSPFLGAPGAQAAGGPGAWMQAAAEGWIAISIEDITSSEALAEFGELSGLGSTAGVDQYFALLDQIDQADPLGPSQVRGVDVEGYRVTVSLEELMALQGASAEDLLGPEFVDLFEDFEYTFEVYVGAEDGRLYAIDVVMDESLFDSFGDQLGEEMPSDFAFEMRMRLELFDHNSTDISVPIPTDAVDVTDQFLGELGSLSDLPS